MVTCIDPAADECFLHMTTRLLPTQCYADDGTRQIHAHHYCSHLNEEVRQCVLYDSDAADARLIGVEYVISRRLFEQVCMTPSAD